MGLDCAAVAGGAAAREAADDRAAVRGERPVVRAGDGLPAAATAEGVPLYPTVQRFFYDWCEAGIWQRINHLLVMQAREAIGREASPSTGLIDSQSTKTTEAGGPRGGACPRASQLLDPGDAGKKVQGRKRHILTDTVGHLVAAAIQPANVQDRDGAVPLLRSIRGLYPWLRHLFADGGYAGPKLADALTKLGRWTVEIVKRSDTSTGFELVPRRWVVEQTLAWLSRNRRLAKDFEASIASAHAWVLLASVKLLTRKLARS
jgi:transposase